MMMESSEGAKFISVSFVKVGRSNSVGLIVGKDVDGDLCIQSVPSEGHLAASPSWVRPGQKIFQLNGQICLKMETAHFTELLGNAVGTINIVLVNETGDPDRVHFVTLSATRTEAKLTETTKNASEAVDECDDKTEKHAESSVRTERTCTDVSSSLSGEEPGSTLGADMTPMGFAKALVHSTGSFIKSLDLWQMVGSSRHKARTNSFTFEKGCKARLGLKLDQGADGHVYIAKISPESVLAQSPIQEGDRISLINGISCLKMDRSAVVSLLGRLSGRCTLVTTNDSGDPDLIESMVEKPTPLAFCGLVMRKNEQESLEVATVTHAGLFANSLLSSGDQICSINSQVCRDVKKADSLLTEASRFVSILARTANRPGIAPGDDLEESTEDELSSDEFDGSARKARPIRPAKQSFVRETPALIESKLKEFDEEFEKKAERINWQYPYVISKDLKMMCLRYCRFDAKMAVDVCMEEAANLV